MIALDASALLALIYRERGSQTVTAHLQDCCMSTVNLAEVISRFVRDGDSGQQLWEQIRISPIEFVLFSTEQAVLAGDLLTHTQPFGLSLGDRACLALASLRGIPALTADRAWAQLNVGVPIQVIR